MSQWFICVCSIWQIPEPYWLNINEMLSENVSRITYLVHDGSDKRNLSGRMANKKRPFGRSLRKIIFSFFVFYSSVEAVADVVDNRLNSQGDVVSVENLPFA